jgi:hypothetical protein
MARTVGELPKGTRITDYVSLGVIAQTFPLTAVRSVRATTAKARIRQRDPPAQVVVYSVIVLAPYRRSSSHNRCRSKGQSWPARQKPVSNTKFWKL